MWGNATMKTRTTAPIIGILFGFAAWLALTYATYAFAGGNETVRPAPDSLVGIFTGFVEFLKATGPLGVAVIAGWVAYKKDKEKNEAVAAASAQMREMYEKVLGIASAQAQATTQMSTAITALKEAVNALGDDLHRKNGAGA